MNEPVTQTRVQQGSRTANLERLQSIDAATIAVQASAVAVVVYGADHQVTRDQINRAMQACQKLSSGVRVMSIGGRTIAENRELPSSKVLQDGLFAKLRGLHADCLWIDSAVDVEAIETFANNMKLGDSGALRVGEHLRIGSIETENAGVGASDLGERTGEALLAHEDAATEAAMLALQRVWSGVLGDAKLNTEHIGGLVETIVRGVTSDRGELIPLNSLKSYDEYTYVHTVNVGILAAGLGQAVGLTGNMLHDLTAAALLHDIGKAKTPEAILTKQCVLSDEERSVIQRHPVDGAMLLCGLKGVPDLAPIVAYEHHMKKSGGGYPATGRKWKMHTASQLVQICDIFDALRTDRPYRKGLSFDNAIAIMQKDVNTVFDPQLLDVFIKHVGCVVDAARVNPRDIPTNATTPIGTESNSRAAA